MLLLCIFPQVFPKIRKFFYITKCFKKFDSDGILSSNKILKASPLSLKISFKPVLLNQNLIEFNHFLWFRLFSLIEKSFVHFFFVCVRGEHWLWRVQAVTLYNLLPSGFWFSMESFSFLLYPFCFLSVEVKSGLKFD